MTNKPPTLKPARTRRARAREAAAPAAAPSTPRERRPRVQAAAPGIAVLGATGSFDASLDEDVAASLRREADATGTALGYRLQA
nr:hypothetical protein [Burkholderia pseudomallei]